MMHLCVEGLRVPVWPMEQSYEGKAREHEASSPCHRISQPPPPGEGCHCQTWHTHRRTHSRTHARTHALLTAEGKPPWQLGKKGIFHCHSVSGEQSVSCDGRPPQYGDSSAVSRCRMLWDTQPKAQQFSPQPDLNYSAAPGQYTEPRTDCKLGRGQVLGSESGARQHFKASQPPS